jgi:hypothetical protein
VPDGRHSSTMRLRCDRPYLVPRSDGFIKAVSKPRKTARRTCRNEGSRVAISRKAKVKFQVR